MLVINSHGNLISFALHHMSSWYDTLTSTPALVAGALGITAVLYARRQTQQQQQQQPKKEEPVKTTKLKTLDKKEKMSSVMSPPAANLLPPKVCAARDHRGPEWHVLPCTPDINKPHPRRTCVAADLTCILEMGSS